MTFKKGGLFLIGTPSSSKEKGSFYRFGHKGFDFNKFVVFVPILEERHSFLHHGLGAT
jgi:hypothetical protein